MYVVECKTPDGKKWLATKGSGKTNYLTPDIEKAFLFEDETVASLYASIWSDGGTPCKVVNHKSSN